MLYLWVGEESVGGSLKPKPRKIKMANRTDVHRPGAIIPANYEPILAYNCSTTMDGWPVPSFGINCELDGRTSYKDADGKTIFVNGTHRANGACCTIAAHAKAHADEKAIFGGPGKCGSCGACFVYGELWLHVPTGEIVHLGHDCADKYNLFMDRSVAELALGRAKAAVGKEIAKVRNTEERAAFLAENPGLETALKVEHTIIADIAARFHEFRSLSPKQVALVLKLANEVLNPPPAEAHVTGPLGKTEFSGTIVGAKLHTNDYGTAWKITVKMATPAGSWLAWGTAPKVLTDEVVEAIEANPETKFANRADAVRNALVGRTVSLRATLEAGRDDHFRFMKRPVLWDGKVKPAKAKKVKPAVDEVTTLRDSTPPTFV